MNELYHAKDATDLEKDAIRNVHMEELSLFLAFGPEKALEIFKYDSKKQKEHSLSHQFVHKLGITQTPMPTGCNSYLPFLVDLKRPSNQLSPFISLCNSSCFAATGPVLNV